MLSSVFFRTPVSVASLRMPGPSRHRSWTAPCIALTLTAWASSATCAAEPAPLPEVTVTGRTSGSGLHLDQPSPTGSRTGLTVRELPASVEAVSGAQVLERGDYAMREAITRTAGLTDIASPGDGGLSFSARGFTGTNSIGLAEDGLRLAVASGTQTYPIDTWGYERIEILRGPASVVFGSGTVGATINAVRKPPQRASAIETLFAAGDHGSARVGVGATGPINEVASYRVDAYGLRSDGVRDLGQASGGKLMSTLRIDPRGDLRFELMADYSLQKPERYFGTPFVNSRLDDSLRKENYNAADSIVRYEDKRLRGRASWQISPTLSVNDEVFYLEANRQWRNIEEYIYNSGTNLVDRDVYLEILHNQTQRGNRAEVAWKPSGHSVVAGWEYSTIDFQHTNNGAAGGSSSVSLHNVAHGNWSSPDATAPKFKTDTVAQGFYVEDAWHATDKLVLLSGLRHDRVEVTRTQLLGGDGLDQTLSGTSARLGLTYTLAPRTNVYVQFSSGHDPVTSLVTLNLANKDFSLTTGRQVEAGIKQSLADGLGDWTAAVYQIKKSNIVTQDTSTSPTTNVQGGSQHSQGVELSGNLRPTRQWRLEGNLAVLSARYDHLVQNSVTLDGKRPNDVPELVANLWTHHRFGNWQASVGARYVGRRYTSTANTATLPSYTVFDASLSWNVNSMTTVRALLRNAADKAYAISTYGDTQALFGEPRRAELVAEFAF
ncbi:TonB-dependent siderophore receptor [Aquabacterium sp. CECT 9606]|uniref:TonB-dependent receptor n=1 Tax=Aquabacterium sp. CECT 9606 TaxID=2845822 RepID=UPI001E38CBE9|nr:TonB-dependent receptor [Aquabacterium sp. CECT 9606]CAH0352862.1 Metal-pseudopaline receptor CntO [Aquabacterium sp. CECT 9606]